MVRSLKLINFYLVNTNIQFFLSFIACVASFKLDIQLGVLLQLTLQKETLVTGHLSFKWLEFNEPKSESSEGEWSDH